MNVDSLDLDLNGSLRDEGCGTAFGPGFGPGRRVRAASPRSVRRGGPVECSGSAPRAGYRMGRWERLGMSVVTASAVVVGLFSSVGASQGAVHSVTIRPGDTLLSVALRELPQVDPARAVELIESASGLSDGPLRWGMTVQVPVLP